MNILKTQVINFNIIHRQVKGEKIDEKLEQKYKIIDNSRIDLYSSAFR